MFKPVHQSSTILFFASREMLDFEVEIIIHCKGNSCSIMLHKIEVWSKISFGKVDMEELRYFN